MDSFTSLVANLPPTAWVIAISLLCLVLLFLMRPRTGDAVTVDAHEPLAEDASPTKPTKERKKVSFKSKKPSRQEGARDEDIESEYDAAVEPLPVLITPDVRPKNVETDGSRKPFIESISDSSPEIAEEAFSEASVVGLITSIASPTRDDRATGKVNYKAMLEYTDPFTGEKQSVGYGFSERKRNVPDGVLRMPVGNGDYLPLKNPIEVDLVVRDGANDGKPVSSVRFRPED